MFEREHHRRIARVLEALDATWLAQNACYFGGGTAIALRFGEYRESIDIDFLVSDRDGYRALRQRLDSRDGLKAILRPGAALEQTRDVRADQYGIRTMIGVDGIDIKFEIVLEGRIELDKPGRTDRVCGIASLTPLDLAASKLLANADRWADKSVYSRDVIDLAMMVPPRPLLRAAIEKAKGAYGDSVERALTQAVEMLRDSPDRLDECMQAMQMTTLPKALLWQRIRHLVR